MKFRSGLANQRPFSMIDHGGDCSVSENGRLVTRNSGGPAWNTASTSVAEYTGSCTIIGQYNGSGNATFGLASGTRSTASLASIIFGWILGGVAATEDNGSPRVTDSAPGTTLFKIAYAGTNVIWSKLVAGSWVQVDSAGTTAGQTFFAKTCIYQSGTSVRIIYFGP